MPPDAVRQADEFGDPVELMLLEAFLVKGLPGLRIGEYPIPILGKRTEAPPPKQQFFKTLVERNIVFRVFRLGFVYALVPPSTVRLVPVM
jgi:hypothetical protein